MSSPFLFGPVISSAKEWRSTYHIEPHVGTGPHESYGNRTLKTKTGGGGHQELLGLRNEKQAEEPLAWAPRELGQVREEGNHLLPTMYQEPRLQLVFISSE